MIYEYHLAIILSSIRMEKKNIRLQYDSLCVLDVFYLHDEKHNILEIFQTI